MAEVKHIQTWNTDYSADSVEWCPIENYKHVFVCGTYQLDKTSEGETTSNSTQKRLGRIYLLETGTNTIGFNLKQTISCNAVLDQKWSLNMISGNPVLGVVHSDGFLRLFKLVSNETKELLLNLVTEVQVSDGLLLSLDWSNGKYSSDEPQIVVSDSKGCLSTYILRNDSVVRVSSRKVHDYEAWICAFDYWNPHIFFSGGDDCKLHVFDLRLSDSNGSTMSNNSHEAGVTAFHSSKQFESGLISGSYDEKIRKWDIRKFRNPFSEKKLGGGVWRLKWHPQKDNTILAACMYGGFRIVKDLGHKFDIMAEYTAHESIAYGADWCHMTDIQFDDREIETSLFATCSFYDCRLDLNRLMTH